MLCWQGCFFSGWTAQPYGSYLWSETWCFSRPSSTRLQCSEEWSGPQVLCHQSQNLKLSNLPLCWWGRVQSATQGQICEGSVQLDIRRLQQMDLKHPTERAHLLQSILKWWCWNINFKDTDSVSQFHTIYHCCWRKIICAELSHHVFIIIFPSNPRIDYFLWENTEDNITNSQMFNKETCRPSSPSYC